MKILSAQYHPSIPRTSIIVVSNPSDPQWVHPDGTPSPVGHTGDTSVDANACKECRLNWRIEEYTWTGDELYNIAEDGTRTAKSEAEILAELKIRAGSSASASNLSTLVNATW